MSRCDITEIHMSAPVSSRYGIFFISAASSGDAGPSLIDKTIPVSTGVWWVLLKVEDRDIGRGTRDAGQDRRGAGSVDVRTRMLNKRRTGNVTIVLSACLSQVFYHSRGRE